MKRPGRPKKLKCEKVKGFTVCLSPEVDSILNDKVKALGLSRSKVIEGMIKGEL